MSGHTPGPWATETDWLTDYETLVTVPSKSGQRGTEIARCNHNWNEADYSERRISWKEAQCNARLIATAPDGLALAQAILADCTDTTPKAWIEMATDIVRRVG